MKQDLTPFFSWRCIASSFLHSAARAQEAGPGPKFRGGNRHSASSAEVSIFTMRFHAKLAISILALSAVWAMCTDARSSDLVEPQLLIDVNVGPDSSALLHMGKTVINLGGRAYFNAGVDSSTGVLLHSDGTVAGTGIVGETAQVLGGAVFEQYKLIVTGHPDFQVLRVNEDHTGFQIIGDFLTIYDARLLEYAGHLYFSCRSSDIFWGLCRTDGTAEGTSVAPLVGNGAGPIVHFANLGSALYFVTQRPSPFGHYMWKKESPEAPPVLLFEFETCDFFAWPLEAIVFPEGLLLPCGASGTAFETTLSILDGTTDDVVDLTVPISWANVNLSLRPVIVDDRVIALAPSRNQETLGLFQIDGQSVAEIGVPALDNPEPLESVSSENAAFLNQRPDGVSELWITDGTAVGTSVVIRFQGDTAVQRFYGSYPTDFGHYFFRVTLVNQNETQLWYVTDVGGIAARPIASLPLGGDFFVPVGRNLVGFAGIADYGVEPAVLKIDSRIVCIFCDGFE